MDWHETNCIRSKNKQFFLNIKYLSTFLVLLFILKRRIIMQSKFVKFNLVAKIKVSRFELNLNEVKGLKLP